MAITDTSAPVEASPEPTVVEGAYPEPTGLAAVVGSGDHKTVGRLWVGFSLFFGVVSFAAVGLSAYRQMKSASFPPAGHEFQLFTAGRIGIVFLFLIPLWVGIGTLVTPLQVGASTIAFGRAAAAALWTWLVGAGVLIASYIADGGLNLAQNLDGSLNKANDLTLVGWGLVIAGLLLGTLCIVTTVITLRAPGMDLYRVPLFSWSMVVAGSVWLLTLPVLIGNLVLILLDHHYGASLEFGKATSQWSQVAWAFTQPQVFAYAIPVLGVLAEVAATFGKARQSGRGVLMTAIGAVGLFSVGAWAQVGFNKDLYNQAIFIGFSVLIGLPVMVVLGGTLATLRKGAPRPAGALVAAVVGVVLLIIAWIGAMLFAGMRELHGVTTQTPANLASFSKFWGDAYPAYQVGITVMVVLAGAAGGLAALFYWGPKFTGSKVGDGGGLLVGLGMLIAALMAGVPYIALAFGNRSAGIDDSLDTLSLISMVGAVIALAALLVTAAALLSSRMSKSSAPDDPWGTGQTLEWATATPPAKGNFSELPLVTSAEPVLDQREGEEV